MKRVVSTILLSVFIFNLGGYHAIHWYFRHQAGVEMNLRLDEADYCQGETVVTKIPLSIPYFFDQDDYERVEGSYEVNGEFFRLVKQKFERDTLYVVSIKDHKEKMLVSALTDFVKLSGNMPSSAQHALKLIDTFMKDFASPVISGPQGRQFCLQDRPKPGEQFDLLTGASAVFSPPPEFTA